MIENKSKVNQRMIQEAIRKIALGRSIDRVDMSPVGTGGVGTARMIHGYVAKVHDNPNDEEFEEYAGTIDVGEFPDETASTTPLTHKGVLLSGLKDNSNGFLIIPTLFSDVTIVSDAATTYKYVVNFSHADCVQIYSHTESSIGVIETEELNPEDNNSPDYDELEPTGNEAKTKYTATNVTTIVKNKNGKEASIVIDPEKIVQTIKDTEINQSDIKIFHKVNNTGITIENNRITIGDEGAIEPLVLGQQLAQLMLDFLTACMNIKTPTMIGTMPTINIPDFATLIPKIQNFLSKTAYTK